MKISYFEEPEEEPEVEEEEIMADGELDEWDQALDEDWDS